MIFFTLGTFLDLAGLRVGAEVALSRFEFLERQLRDTYPHIKWDNPDDTGADKNPKPTEGLMLSSYKNEHLVIRRELYRFRDDWANPETSFRGELFTFGSSFAAIEYQFAYAQPRLPPQKTQAQTTETVMHSMMMNYP